MDTAAIRAWAHEHDPAATWTSDPKKSLTSKLARCHLDGVPTVAVGHDADNKVKINSVLDAVAWTVATGGQHATVNMVNVVIGVDDTGARREVMDAIATVAASLTAGPTVHLFTLTDTATLTPHPTAPVTFPTEPTRTWAGYLETARTAEPTGLAAALVNTVDHPAVALYPKLSGITGEWQIRIDGLDVGRVNHSQGTLTLASSNLNTAGTPRDQWRTVIGTNPIPFDTSTLDVAAAKLRELITEFTTPGNGVLQHGQAEHALEAHILTGRTQLNTDHGPLRPAVPYSNGVVRAAQFPTLWGNVTSPARYLDALMADPAGRAWAVELKDPRAGGGNGAYLRAGITQAVLYRHYIHTAHELATWFHTIGVNHHDCQAAVAWPTEAAGVADRHRTIANLCGVEVIEFPKP